MRQPTEELTYRGIRYTASVNVLRALLLKNQTAYSPRRHVEGIFLAAIAPSDNRSHELS
jgi:hypothetical protein